MSRKWLLVLVAIIGAIAALLSEQFGLSPNFKPAVAGLGLFVVYIFNEAKADWKRMASQLDKWKDPKFWGTFVGGIIAVLATAGINVPAPEIIVGIITFIIGVLFKVKPSVPA